MSLIGGNNQTSDDISKDLIKTGGSSLRGVVSNVGKKVGKGVKKVGGRLLKSGGRAVVKMGLFSGGVFLGGFIFVGGLVILLFVIAPSTKSYDCRYINNNNSSTTTITNYSDSESGTARARSGLTGVVGSITKRVVTREIEIKLSEENQAIENYHYYNSMKSLYENKYYIPLKEVDLSKVKGDTTLDKMLEKGVLKFDKEKEQLVFNEKYIGELEEITDEAKKVEIKDEYEREPYFQLPEELLGMLNTVVYAGELIYDKPFLKGIPIKYAKTEETDLGRPVYEFRGDTLAAKNGNISKTSGLGSVFIYKPSFEFGEAAQESESEDKDNSESEDIKVKYLLDRVVTFAGVYKFEYEVETEIVDGKVVSQKEVPKDVVRETVDVSYIKNYLKNLTIEVPKNLYRKFETRHLIEAFKGVKGSMLNESSGGGNGEVGSGGNTDVENVEKWRELVEEISAIYGVNPNVIMCMIYSESSGNPHAGNSNYKGLIAMGGNISWIAPYYENTDPKDVGGNYLNLGKSGIDPRLPTCSSKGPHNEASHRQAAIFQIHYACRRLSDAMYLHCKLMYNKEPTQLTSEEMFYVLAASIGSYNTGQGGQNTMRKLANYDYAMLYGNEGENWSKYHFMANKVLNGAINSKDNHTYMKKKYEVYPLFSDGKSFQEAGDLSLYDPSKWYVTKSTMKQCGKDSVVGPALSQVSTGTNGMSIDSAKVTEYMLFEEGKTGDIKGLSTIKRSLSSEEVELILEQSIGMMDGEVYLESKNSKSVFWKEGFEDVYFRNGEAVKPPPGYNMESGIWKDKIMDESYTGDTDSIRNLAKNYGQGMFKVINRFLNQVGMPYKENSYGIQGFDMGGLIWYGFNYGEEKNLFERADIKEYAENFNNNVEEEDIRPGDVTFFAKPWDEKEEIEDAIIYLGNDAGLYVSSETGGVVIIKYSEFIGESDKRVSVGTKRILKFTQGIVGEFDENKAALNGMPAGFVEGDYVFPILFKKASDIRLTDGVGVRQIHPASKKRNIPHFGVDYAGPVGTPIIATKKGRVIRAGNSGNAAGFIVVLDHLDGSTSAYYHLHPGTIKVQVGQLVEQGQELAGLGNSGIGTGAHLHFEIAIGLPNHVHGPKKDMEKFVPIQNMFKELGIADTRKVPHNTIYPGEPSHWNNRNN